MFSSKKKSPNPSSQYAFGPNTAAAANSSDAVRRQEQETIYHPLPPSTRHGTSKDSTAPVPSASATRNPFADSYQADRNSSSTSASLNQSRSGSPSLSHPLLSHGNNDSNPPSPVTPTHHGNAFARNSPANMPAPSRSYARDGAAGMPPRGESRNALLRDGQASNGRRYGPTASSAPVGAGTALLNSPSQSSSDKTALSNENVAWGGFDHNNPEADDYLHNPDPKRDRGSDRGTIFTTRGLLNIGCLLVLILCLLTLFAGYPIITFYTKNTLNSNGGYNLGGINSTGQIPLIANFPDPIDPDTPQDARTRTGFDGHQYNLVFSDEFNKDGRSFWPGDDPFFTAVDLHYWPTTDFEWYHPSAATTRDGNLVITMTQENINELNFKSGMLQSWNQMCFQYSMYIEAKVSLPGTPEIGGFWPGVWTMGNLGRPGYGATTEGMWPYTYDSCDVGTLPNQTNAAGTGPELTLTGAPDGSTLSYLPGQRASACTCPGEDHPGPDVTYGRSSPEIDILEAQTDLSRPRGQVSQSFQIAPFDYQYQFSNTSKDVIQYDTTLSQWNPYKGAQFQQAVSTVVYIDNDNYQLTNQAFGIYGFEMWADPNNRDDGYITWVSDGVKSWTLHASAVGPNAETEIGQRLIPEEPMAMIINFGMSNGFQTVDFEHLQWPAEMHIDYIRVYQRPEGKMGCDPADRPTADYIARHRNAYDNANFTQWADAGYTFPKNRLKDTC